MEYTNLGNSGLRVSRIALGCMSFGDISTGFNEWALDEEAAAPYFQQAVELGITFWDTANVYNFGTSEEFVGRAIKKFSRREDIVLATKIFFKMHDGPGGSVLSRKAVMEQVDASLRRLGTDYIDLYQIHRVDPNTPVEETMEALHDVVKAGKVRYLGASAMWAWQFSKMQYVASANGWTRFISMQDQYSAIYREEEQEMFPLLSDLGVSSMPYSPLGKGRLARPFGEMSFRAEHDPVGAAQFGNANDRDRGVINAVEAVAAAREVPMAQVSLAWALANPVVASPIVGATKPHHLADAVAALDLVLTSDEMEAIRAPYVHRLPVGFV